MTHRDTTPVIAVASRSWPIIRKGVLYAAASASLLIVGIDGASPAKPAPVTADPVVAVRSCRMALAERFDVATTFDVESVTAVSADVPTRVSGSALIRKDGKLGVYDYRCEYAAGGVANLIVSPRHQGHGDA